MVWFYFGFSAAFLYDFMASLFPAPAARQEYILSQAPIFGLVSSVV